MRFLLIALLYVLATSNAGVSGNWQGSFRVDGADHDVPQLLLLKEDHAKLTGTGGPDETERYPISNGEVQGDHATFELTTGEWKFFYDLKYSGSQMNGKLVLKSATDSRTG